MRVCKNFPYNIIHLIVPLQLIINYDTQTFEMIYNFKYIIVNLNTKVTIINRSESGIGTD